MPGSLKVAKIQDISSIDSGGTTVMSMEGGGVAIEGDMSLKSHLLPDATQTYDIGHTDYMIRNLHVQSLFVHDKVNSHLLPVADVTYDLGSAQFQWRDVYTGDLHLSNEKLEKGNDVDGTKGNWTIQEGEDDLYLINNKNGKKYKFNLTEVS